MYDHLVQVVKVWPLLVLIFGMGAWMARIDQKSRQNCRAIIKLRSEIYRNDGSTVYVPRYECEHSTEKNLDGIDKQFAGVHTKLAAMDAARGQAHEDETGRRIKYAEDIASVRSDIKLLTASVERLIRMVGKHETDL